jgi:hypothetical protein
LPRWRMRWRTYARSWLTKSTGEIDNEGNNSSSDEDNDSIGSEDVDGDADDLSEEEG